MAHIYVVEYSYFLKMVCVYVWFMTLNHSEVGMSMLTCKSIFIYIMSLSFRLDVGDVPLVRALKLSSRVYYGCKPWNPNL